jgi:hypothetical protein
MHRQGFWAEQAGNPRLALWHRVYALAYGVHRRNGHAPFKPGELGLAVALVDATTGELLSPRADVLSRAIGTCVDYGFLSPQSCARCLVVPSFAIEGGVLGRVDEPCRQQHSRREE